MFFHPDVILAADDRDLPFVELRLERIRERVGRGDKDNVSQSGASNRGKLADSKEHRSKERGDEEGGKDERLGADTLKVFPPDDDPRIVHCYAFPILTLSL